MSKKISAKWSAYLISALMLTSSANSVFAEDFAADFADECFLSELPEASSSEEELFASEVYSGDDFENGMSAEAFPEADGMMAEDTEMSDLEADIPETAITEAEFAEATEPALANYTVSVDDSQIIDTVEYGDYRVSILENNTCRIVEYLGDETNVIIPDSFDGIPVSSINGLNRNGVFRYKDALESVVIPDGIQKIGIRSFYHCDNLKNITVPDSVLEFDEYAFEWSFSIEEINFAGAIGTWNSYNSSYSWKNMPVHCAIPLDYVVNDYNEYPFIKLIEYSGTDEIFEIPSSIHGLPVESIDLETLLGNPYVKTVVLPSSLKSSSVAFAGNTVLEHVIIPEGITKLDFSCFEDCTALTQVDGIEHVTDIASSAFNNTPWLEAQIANCPNGILIFGNTVYDLTNASGMIEIPEGITRIDNSALSRNASDNVHNITGISIPKSCTSIPHYDLAYCPNLSTIVVDPENEAFVVEDGILYTKGSGRRSLLVYPSTKNSARFNIPANTTAVAGIHNPYLEEVTFNGDSIQLRNNFFKGCTSLKKVTFPQNCNLELNPNSFRDTVIEEMILPANTILYSDSSGRTFSKMTALKSISISPDSESYVSVDGVLFSKDMTYLSHYPANKAGTEYRIPDGVKVIYSMNSVKNLKNLIIPASVTTFWLDEDSTDRDLPLDLYYLGTEEQWANVRIGSIWGYPATGYTVHFGEPVHSYKVTFKANGGTSLSKNSITVTEQQPYGTLPTVKRTGYTFSGWYTAKTGGKKITAKSIVNLTADQTLYAHWTAKTFKVTFNANGGTGLSASTKSVTYDKTYGTLPTVNRAGYSFEGWYTAKTAGKQVTASTKVAITKAQTLYARWKKITVAKATAPTVSNSTSKTLSAKWTAVKNVDGYEVLYSLNKGFSNAKTKSVTKNTASISKLTKGKTYYVKIRAYKKDSAGKKVYGSYSSVKSCKIQK